MSVSLMVVSPLRLGLVNYVDDIKVNVVSQLHSNWKQKTQIKYATFKHCSFVSS